MTERARFAHGVASGDPLADRVVIWTRVDGRQGDVPVGWVVASDEALTEVVARGEATARADADHTVKVDVAGLSPSSEYFYAFESDGDRSPVGRTRTLPEGEVANVRFAAYSCAKYSAGYFNAYARIAERDDIDFVLCLGDYIYEYGNDESGLGAEIGRAFRPDHECRTLEDYRTRYAQYREDPDTQALHHRHPLIAIPDDHEICDDTWRDGAEKHDPDEDGPWEVRKAAALQAWREWLPVRVQEDEPIYRAFHLGNLAELVLLDTRTQRDEQVKPPESEAEDRSLLGKDQFDWFTARLRDSDALWKVVGQGVLISQVYSEFAPEELDEALSELGVLTPKEFGPEPDQWDGYPAERDRLLVDVRDNDVRNIVFLSGDVHSSWVADLELDPHDETTRPIAVELSVTSLTSENLDEHMGWTPRTRSIEVEREFMELNPHVKWCDFDSHGFTVVDLTQNRVAAEWWYVGDITKRDPEVRLGAAWQVDQGEHRARRADAPLDRGRS